MKKAGEAVPIVTERASAVVFLTKKDGRFRFWVDHCCLYAVPVRECYLIERTVEFKDSLDAVEMI